MTNIDHISYNGWKSWYFCPFKFKIERIEKIEREPPNEFTCFGHAIHQVSEQLAAREQEIEKLGGIKDDDFSLSDIFISTFEKEIVNIPIDKKRDDLINEMKEQGKELAVLLFPAMKKYFGDFVFISSEQEIKVALKSFKEHNIDFQGYIDLILQTKKDGKYHIVDLKSCRLGLGKEKEEQ